MSTKSQRLRLKERREFFEQVEANRTAAYDKQSEKKNADLSEENAEAKNEPKPKKKATTTKKKASQKAK